MSAKKSPQGGNLVFWIVLLALSAGAFAVGFKLTYGATTNVSVRSPLASPMFLPSPLLREAALASPSPAPTPAGLLTGGASGAVEASPAQAPGARLVVKPVDHGRPLAPSSEPSTAETPQAVAASPATPRPVVPQPVVYRVQVGSFDDQQNAQVEVQDLQAAGLNAMVVYEDGHYHAQLGAFRNRDRAISIADDANMRGYSVVIRH